MMYLGPLCSTDMQADDKLRLFRVNHPEWMVGVLF